MKGARRSVEIVLDDLTGDEIATLLATHLAEMYRTSPPGSVHALDLEALKAPEITFWTAWDEGTLVGCAALKALGGGEGEIKSMHTRPFRRGAGIGAALLTHLIETARRRGWRRLSLETGATDAFAAAQGLYRRFGFTPCAPFAHYREDPHSLFLTLEL